MPNDEPADPALVWSAMDVIPEDTSKGAIALVNSERGLIFQTVVANQVAHDYHLQVRNYVVGDSPSKTDIAQLAADISSSPAVMVIVEHELPYSRELVRKLGRSGLIAYAMAHGKIDADHMPRKQFEDQRRIFAGRIGALVLYHANSDLELKKPARK